MRVIKALIVDDELAARNIINNLLNFSFPEIQIVDKVANVPDAVLAIKEHKPDLVFLDIEMPKYAGYELVKFFDVIDFNIIFVTAYNQYAIKAFEMNAIDYLLKPIERNRLAEAIEKVKIRISEKKITASYHQLLDQLESENHKTIIISESNKKHCIQVRNIIGVQAQGAYADVFVAGDGKITISKNIGHFEKLLTPENNFFRSHKSWLINTQHITSFSKGDLTIALTDGIYAKLSRFKKAELNTLI